MTKNAAINIDWDLYRMVKVCEHCEDAKNPGLAVPTCDFGHLCFCATNRVTGCSSQIGDSQIGEFFEAITMKKTY